MKPGTALALVLCVTNTAMLVRMSVGLHKARATLALAQRNYDDLQYGYEELEQISLEYLQQLRTCGMTGAEPTPYKAEIRFRR